MVERRMTAADSTLKIPCFVFALNRELNPFRRHFSRRRRILKSPCEVHLLGEYPDAVAALVTGVGPKRMEAVLTWLWSGPVLDGRILRPLWLVAAGFCGALEEGLAAGEVVQASEVVDVQGGWWRTTLPNELSIAVLRQGRLVTVPRLVSQPQAKSQLALAHQAAIVDMESAVAA